MIISLIGIGSSSAADHVLAGRLESSLSGLAVQCFAVQACSRAQLESVTARILDTSPDLVAICCTVWNVGLVMELCQRLGQIMPGVAVVLGGPEAPAQPRKLKELAAVTQVIPHGEDVAARLIQLVTELGSLTASRTPPPHSSDPYNGRVGDLVRASRDSTDLVVEPIWGGDNRVWMHRHLRPSLRYQDPHVVAARLAPLLQAGLGARLADPLLVSSRTRLNRLLVLLEDQGDGLVLELPDSVLEDAIEGGLARSGVRHVLLELWGLISGEVDPLDLQGRIRRLSEGGVTVQGELTYGLPSMDWADFGRAVDRCVASGVDQLRMQRLVASPGSAPREEGVVYAESPPHEVLSTSGATAAELVAMARFAALFQQVNGALAGTGLLRALAREAGSIFEIVEGFGDGLAIEGRDVMTGDVPQPVGLHFSAYLESLGFCMRPDDGGVRLRRARHLALRWTEDQHRVLFDEATGKSVQVGWGTVGLVDRLGQARPLNDVCETLVSEVPADRRGKLRRDLYRTVDKLVTLGVLVPAQTPSAQERELPVVSLEEFDYHYRMLADQARMKAYSDAIGKVIKPGDHVVEIGTGTGILAVLAARAGARVTAIERYSILDMARAVARHSGVAHLIDFVRSDADRVDLDHPGDVLLSEIVGNRILNEGLLEATLDARQRLLRPDARLIPRRIEIHAQLGYSDRFDHVAKEFHRIGKLHAVDLGPLTRWFDDYLAVGKVVWEQGPKDNDGFVGFSAAERMASLDLGAIKEAGFNAAASILPGREGTANALVLSFRLTLLPGIVLSSHDQRTKLHWCRPVYMLRQPVVCRPDREVRVELSYEAHGEIGVSVS